MTRNCTVRIKIKKKIFIYLNFIFYEKYKQKNNFLTFLNIIFILEHQEFHIKVKYESIQLFNYSLNDQELHIEEKSF